MNKTDRKILISGVNWLGDVCMALPAIQRLHSESEAAITVLSKPGVQPLWDMSPAVAGTVTLDSSMAGMVKTASKIKDLEVDAAYILPNSWRSALIPFMAGVPRRIGYPGHNRRVLLTDCIIPSTDGHQQYEFAEILGVSPNDLPPPHLVIPSNELDAARTNLQKLGSRPLIGILPGAARGPSKQWPPQQYISAAKLIGESNDCGFVLLGTSLESRLCQHIAAEIGRNALSLAGNTTLARLAAILSICDTVLCNDSGGMHLAAACGTCVTAIFGITDASKTGPLGKGHRILQPEGISVSRSIPRESEEARKALLRTTPQEVAAAALEIINRQDAATG